MHAPERLKTGITAKLAPQVGKDQAEVIADRKARSVGRGVGLIVLGCVVAGAALALVFRQMALTGEAPGVALLAFAGLFALVGLGLIIRGANRMSGEALDIAGEMGGIVGLLAKLIRGNGQ